MLKNMINTGTILSNDIQKRINGGNACIACYDHCVLTSSNRFELGDCFDNCQQTVC